MKRTLLASTLSLIGLVAFNSAYSYYPGFYPEEIKQLCENVSYPEFDASNEETLAYLRCLNAENRYLKAELDKAKEQALAATDNAEAKEKLQLKLDAIYASIQKTLKEIAEEKDPADRVYTVHSLQADLVVSLSEILAAAVPPFNYSDSPYQTELIREDFDEALKEALQKTENRTKLEEEEGQWTEAVESFCAGALPPGTLGNAYGTEVGMLRCIDAFTKIRTEALRKIAGIASPVSSPEEQSSKDFSVPPQLKTKGGLYASGFYPAKTQQLCKGWIASGYSEASKRGINCLSSRVTYLQKQVDTMYPKVLSVSNNKKQTEREQLVFEKNGHLDLDSSDSYLDLLSGWMALTIRVLQLANGLYPIPNLPKQIELICRAPGRNSYKCDEEKTKWIDAEYKKLLAKQQGKAKTALKASQQAWQRDSKTICNFSEVPMPHYLAAGPSQAECEGLWISLRAAELAALAKETNK